MGGCRRGFRGYLDELQEAGAEQKQEAFNLVKTGNASGILALLNRYPGLLKQASDDEHKANLIISILYEIKTTRSKRVHDALIKLLKTIITEHRDKLDLTFRDKDGNTALHRAFWYAITSQNAATSKALSDIGVAFLKLIKDATHFRQIIALKNIHNESFLQNIYLGNVELSQIQQQNLEKVQNLVGPLLNPYKRQAKTGPQAPLDFKAKSFKARLEELLTEPVTLDLIEEPVVFIKEGHTLDRATWAILNPKKSPLTRTDFKDSELQPNATIAEVLKLYKLHAENEEVLIISLTEFFGSQQAGQSIDDLFVSNKDVLTEDIKDLLENYNRQYQQLLHVDDDHSNSSNDVTPSNSDSDIEEISITSPLKGGFSNAQKTPPTSNNPKASISEIIKKLKRNIENKTSGRETWFDSNTDTKVAKLETIATWVNSKQSLKPDETALILALVRDVCAIKRNSWGIFQPHSLAEFNELTAKKKLKAPADLSFDTLELLRLEDKKDGLSFIDEQMRPSSELELS
ncbi:hypothetical protein BN59_01905 [Legionella massiliensis]|uniref:Uncharacterized protein n=1 Tax=Legionella massiliensis TaxID=1034943 RepID=A0A078KXB6_9GAMM|nr:hypothetical protein [Legionella massiliensis]CDZ77621.1 hypothetical protein BN59_01905 [Legionella massiliensis]CEE13359.1 hypothetical protein BN1094_01905 [Legionella massiliensis]